MRYEALHKVERAVRWPLRLVGELIVLVAVMWALYGLVLALGGGR